MQRRHFLEDTWPELEIYETLAWDLPGFTSKKRHMQRNNQEATASLRKGITADA